MEKIVSFEGEESPRTVVIEFSSFEIAEKFYNSKEYQEAEIYFKRIKYKTISNS